MRKQLDDLDLNPSSDLDLCAFVFALMVIVVPILLFGGITFLLMLAFVL